MSNLQAPPNYPVIVVHADDGNGLTACTGQPMPRPTSDVYRNVPRYFCQACARVNGDEQRRKENEARVAAGSDLMLCDRCDGTGNEFMYRQCAECGGVGVGDREPERSVNDERET